MLLQQEDCQTEYYTETEQSSEVWDTHRCEQELKEFEAPADVVRCNICGERMPKHEMPDHAIAHTVHQQIIERQFVNSVAEIAQFFEDEELEVETSATKVRGLTR